MPILDKNDGALERYRRFIEESPYGSAFQDPRWASVKKGWGSAQVYLEKDGKITAALSLLIKRTGPFSMLYAPRGPVCDPRDAKTIWRLLDEARPIARRARAFMLRMDPPVGYDEALCRDFEAQGFRVRGRGLAPQKLIQPRLNMVLGLKGETEQTLFPKFSRTARAYIRAAQREGVRIWFGRDEETLARFYSLYAGTTRRKRFGKRSLSYLRRILSAYDGARIFMAEHEGDLLAGELCVHYGKGVWCAYSGTASIKPRHRASSLMRWEMIRWALEIGCESFDFGGVFSTDKSDGLYEYKERFCRKDGHTEYIGELDYVYHPVVYSLVLRFGPFVQKKLRRLRKKLRKIFGKKEDAPPAEAGRE